MSTSPSGSGSTSPSSSGSGSRSSSSPASTSTGSPGGGATPNNSTGLPSPSVLSQTPIFACVPASYSISNGTPPYTVVQVIQSGVTDARTLKTLPSEEKGGTFSWGVDITPGTSITFVAKDSKNQTGYSAPIVIQSPQDGNLHCLDPPHHNKSIAGPVVGGVVGGLAAVVALYFLVTWWTRRQRTQLRNELVNAGEIEVETVEAGYGRQEERVVRRPTLQQRATAGSDVHGQDVPLTSGAATVARAGTYNLHGVPIRERDPDTEALEHPPPRYPRTEAGSSAASVNTDREIRGP